MPSRNAVTFSGNRFPASRREGRGPIAEDAANGRVQPRDLLLRQAPRELGGREPRPVKDLVRVRVADPGKEPRIGQGALQRVALARERLPKGAGGPPREPRGLHGRRRRAPAGRATRWSDARLLVLASERTSAPSSKSNAARAPRPPTRAPRFFQCSRPAIIRCRTTNRSPSSAKTIRLPIRSRPVTIFPDVSATGGAVDRSRKGLPSRIDSSRRPRTRGERAARYAEMSGSSGTARQA